MTHLAHGTRRSGTDGIRAAEQARQYWRQEWSASGDYRARPSDAGGMTLPLLKSLLDSSGHLDGNG